MGWRVMNERTVFSLRLTVDLGRSSATLVPTPTRHPDKHRARHRFSSAAHRRLARRLATGLGSDGLGAHPSHPACRQLASRTDELRGPPSGPGRAQARPGLDPAADAHRRRRCRQDQARPAGRSRERPPVPRWRLVRRAGAHPGSRARRPGGVHRARTPGPLIELGGLHPERLSGRQTAPPDPRQLRARPRCRGRPGGNAAARLSRRADPGHEPAGARGHRRSRDRRAHPVVARRWRCVAGGPPAIGRRGPVRGARRCRSAGLRRGRRERRRDPAASAPTSTASRSRSSWRRSGSMPSASTRSIVDSLPGSGRWARATAAYRSGSRPSRARSTGATSS